MDNLVPVILLVGLIAIALVVSKYFACLDHQRIREHVESSGGTVLNIVRNLQSGWRRSRDRAYDVRYKTRHDVTLTATCRTGVFSGIYWVSNMLPSGSDQIPETSIEPELMECPACGWKITAQQTHCSRC